MLVARMPEAFQVEYLDCPIPDVEPGRVLLENKYLGVCASDQQIYHGRHKYMKFPLVMGHEVSAVIKAVGAGVTGFQVGERVTIEPQIVCGECYPCSVGRFNVCESLKVIGVHMDGCACEYIQVLPWNLHKLPAQITDVQGALIEPLAVGMGSVHRAGDVAGRNVAVIGAGIIGNFTAQCAKALGAKVLISDVVPLKLKTAEECGIDYVNDASKYDLDEATRRAFGDFHKADVIIDCAASKGSFVSALKAARKNSKIVISGNYKDIMEFDVPVIQRSEISLIGHMMYVKEDFQESIRCLEEGLIHTEGLVTQHFPLSHYADAFKFADEHPADTIKMIIDIGE